MTVVGNRGEAQVITLLEDVQMFGRGLRIGEMPDRDPEGLRHFGRVRPIDGVGGHREHEGGDCKLWSAPHGLDIIQTAEQGTAREKIDADLLHGFPDRRGEIIFVCIPVASWKGHVAGPGIGGGYRPFDEEQLQIRLGKAHDEGDGGASGDGTRGDEPRCSAGECSLQLPYSVVDQGTI